jgi:hypothetical protein
MSYKNPTQHGWTPYSFEHIPEVRRVEQIVRNNLMQDERSEA